jgi:alkanesulfonate monooxygenase
MATVITGRDAAEAKAKLEDYRRYVDHEAALALFSGWTGVDFSKYALDEPLRHVETDASRSAIHSFLSGEQNRAWTVKEVAEHVAIGGRGPVLVGSPGEIADELIAWVETTDIDGFNLAYAVTPESFADVVDLVVPELQRRGVYKHAYRAGTLREKLFGPGRARLPMSHPGAAHRRGGA